MPQRITSAELRQLRNCIPIRNVIHHLGQPTKHREGHFRFLCPVCQEFHTDVHPDTNLARCFRCERNFNPIDMVLIVERVSFLDAVAILRDLLQSADQTSTPTADSTNNPPRIA